MKPIPTERRKRILKDINKWNDHSRRSKVECLDFLHRQTQTSCPGNRTQTKTPDATLEKSRDVPALQQFLLKSGQLFTKKECHAYFKHDEYNVNKR